MARKADAASVSDAIRPADYRGSVQLLRTIKAKKDKVSSINGEIADIVSKATEGKKVSKIAAVFFRKIDVLEPEERLTVMRDFNKLFDAAGYDEHASDLVDQAEGSVVSLRPGRKTKPVPDMDGPSDDKEPEPAAQGDVGGAVGRFRDAKAAVTEHFSGGSSH